jgi:RNA polymerase sigma factor (sigma-70 family)
MTNSSGGHVSPGVFTTTHWSVILEAKSGSEAALNWLCARYRGPIITWLRARGYPQDDLEDLVHGFFAALLRRHFLRNVSVDKGRFRTFLLTSLKNHLSDARDKSDALKRGGGQPGASLQETDDHGNPIFDPAGPDTAPDREFDRNWAHTVLEQALGQLETECARTGHAPLYEALKPVLLYESEAALRYEDIGERLGMSKGAVKVAAHRIRHRLGGILRETIRPTVESDKDVAEELEYMANLFGQ